MRSPQHSAPPQPSTVPQALPGSSPPSNPPYSLAPHRFPFRALALRAAEAPIGGAREVALACFMAARLAAVACLGTLLPPAARARRAASARAWFASIALPAPIRTAVARVTDAVAQSEPGGVPAALAALLPPARRHLDHGSIAELGQLIRALETTRRPPAQSATKPDR